MAHLQTLRLTSFGSRVHCAISNDGSRLALPASHSNREVALYDFDEGSFKFTSKKFLKEHSTAILALCFGQLFDRIATASLDSLILWDLEEKSFQVLQRDCGNISSLSFNETESMLLVCISARLLIVNLDGSPVVSFDCRRDVIESKFLCPPNEDLIVALVEDRSFVIFDVVKKKQMFLSPIEPSDLGCLATNEEGLMVIGSLDGAVNVYQIYDSRHVEVLYRMDAARAVGLGGGVEVLNFLFFLQLLLLFL
jgi:WD40 repeat protein